jgi:hypothetical protein
VLAFALRLPIFISECGFGGVLKRRLAIRSVASSKSDFCVLAIYTGPPMTAPDFYGPNLKVERAKHHIDNLETIFEQFISRNIKRLRLKRDNRFLERKGAAASRLFPKHTPTVLGDALHNLKSALDHAYCIMVEENGRTVTRHTLFPFGEDRESLKGSINGQKLKGLTPSDAVIDIILNEIQPYEAGKLGLYGLHLLDITDKHHVLIPTTANMVIREPTELLDEFGQKTGYTISGMTLVRPCAQ